MEYKNIIIEEDAGIGFLKINRPKALNALNTEVLTEIKEVVEHLDEKEDIKVIIITGVGKKAFAAGADIAEMEQLNCEEARQFARRGQKVFSIIEKCSKPVIAAVNGFALGGGNELALACDIRIAADNAKFGQPESGLGIIAGFGGTQRLSGLVGEGKAKELLFTAKMIDAQEALQMGLVNKVVKVEELLAEAGKMAAEIAKQAPYAIKMTKEAVNFGLQEGIEKGLLFESNAFSLCFGTEDQKRGMGAFLKREKPEFKGN